jgi:hypothetical protein
MSSAVERFSAYGHPAVTATHRSTFEITAEEEMTPAGTCIIAVRSEKGARDLSEEFRSLIRHPGASLTTTLACREVTVTIRSSGAFGLTLEHQTDLVWRRSSFVCGRTIGTYSDSVAATLPRDLITLLQNRERLEIELRVEAGDQKDMGEEPVFPPCLFPGSG